MNVKIRQQIVKIPFLHNLSWRIVNWGNAVFYFHWKEQNKQNDIWKKILEEPKKDECYIIGNGPSLSIEDLKKIRDKDCFVSNKFYKIQKELDFVPMFYVIQDRYCVDNSTLEFLEAKYILLSDYFWRTHDFQLENAFCFHTKRVIGNERIRFGDCNTAISEAYTVTFSMIQIAISLGYKKIYLLGIDHNYPFTYDETGKVVRDESIKAHFYGGEKVDDFICNVEGMNRAYLCAKEFADSNEIKIINVTRGGKLEVFERKNLEDAI